MKRGHAFFSVIAAAAALSVSVSLPASAAEKPEPAVTDEVRDSLIQFWDEVDVPQGEQDALVAAIEDGVTPLSLRADATPVETETTNVGVFNRTTETFADGSIRVADVQVEPGLVTAVEDFGATEAATTPKGMQRAEGAISGCSASSGSGYANRDNCLVRGTSGSVTNFFYASYTLVQGAANDQLRSTVNPGQTCVWPYSCSVPSRSNYVARESFSTRAGATYTGTANTAFSSQTTYLSITVGNNTAFATFTMP